MVDKSEFVVENRFLASTTLAITPLTILPITIKPPKQHIAMEQRLSTATQARSMGKAKISFKRYTITLHNADKSVTLL